MNQGIGAPVDDPPELRNPRATAEVYGHDDAQAEFLAAYNASRIHHAWLITGPKGIGKATLAWRFVKHLLYSASELQARPPSGGSVPATSLAAPSDHPVVRRIIANSEPTAIGVEVRPSPKTGRLQKFITVGEIRELRSFFSMTSADGLPLAAVIDSPDDMNASAANALLKLLEEPPDNAYFFLVSHSPSGLLATIRSRCRKLHCKPLTLSDMEKALVQLGLTKVANNQVLSQLSEGSVGTAANLACGNGIQTLSRIVEVFAGAPGIDRSAMLAFANGFDGSEPESDLAAGMRLMALSVARLARSSVFGATSLDSCSARETELFGRLASEQRSAKIWAHLHGSFLTKAADALATNADPVTAIIDLCIDFDRAANEVSTM